jgi:hypothetical protein
LVNESREAIALVKKRDNLHVEMGAMAKVSTQQQSAAARIDDYCKDLAEWPRSWMGLPKDLVPGEKMVAYFRPFLEHLIHLGLSKKTIRKHVDNLWVLGGEMIRDPHETPSLRKVPIETLVFQVIQDGGPILYPTTPRSRSGLLHPPAASFADSGKAVRAWHPPRGGRNDERGKSPKPRTGFPSFLESANPALPTFPPHGYCCCLRFNTPSKQIKATTTVALLATSQVTHGFFGGAKNKAAPKGCLLMFEPLLTTET